MTVGEMSWNIVMSKMRRRYLYEDVLSNEMDRMSSQSSKPLQSNLHFRFLNGFVNPCTVRCRWLNVKVSPSLVGFVILLKLQCDGFAVAIGDGVLVLFYLQANGSFYVILRRSMLYAILYLIVFLLESLVLSHFITIWCPCNAVFYI